MSILKAIRRNCLDCSGECARYVKWCPCDGLHSTKCEFWTRRFGCRPDTVADQRFVIPACMPPAEASLELSDTELMALLKPLPEGHSVKPKRKLTEQQKAAAAKGLREWKEAQIKADKEVA